MYDDIREVWKAEHENKELQQLRPSFYREVATYLKELATSATQANSNPYLQSLSEKEHANARNLLEDLFTLRLRKLVESSLRGEPGPIHLLTDEEVVVAKQAGQVVSEHLEVLKQILEGKLQAGVGLELAKEGRMLVRLLSDVPEIVGVDLKTYGPFKAEDVAYIPTENAIALIKQGAAKRIEVAVPAKAAEPKMNK